MWSHSLARPAALNSRWSLLPPTERCSVGNLQLFFFPQSTYECISLLLLGTDGIFFISGTFVPPALQTPCWRSQEAPAGQQWTWSLQQTAYTRHKVDLLVITVGRDFCPTRVFVRNDLPPSTDSSHSLHQLDGNTRSLQGSCSCHRDT